MDFNDDKHIVICQIIEVGLRKQYELHPEFTDIKMYICSRECEDCNKKGIWVREE